MLLKKKKVPTPGIEPGSPRPLDHVGLRWKVRFCVYKIINELYDVIIEARLHKLLFLCLTNVCFFIEIYVFSITVVLSLI